MVVHIRTFKQVDELTKGESQSLTNKVHREESINIDLSERRITVEGADSRVSLNSSHLYSENRENRRFTKKTEDHIYR